MFGIFKKWRKAVAKPIGNIQYNYETVPCGFETVIYGFENMKIEYLAELLKPILEVRLYPYQSPMDGPWFSSEDPRLIDKLMGKGSDDTARAELLEEMKKSAEKPSICVHIKLNDPDPHYGPQFPDGGDCLLIIEASPEKHIEFTDKLQSSDLIFKELKREKTQRLTPRF